MPDEADLAQISADQDLERALRVRRPALAHTGTCHNCCEAIPAGAFCDADCRGDYEARARACSRSGRSVLED